MKIDVKSTAGPIIYTICFIILFILISKVNAYFSNMFSETYRHFPWVIYAILMYIPIGLYLGLPNFLKEIKKSGKWKINLNKIVFICIPMLCLSFYFYFPIFYPIPDILLHTETIFRFGTIVFGYFLIDSIRKATE